MAAAATRTEPGPMPETTEAAETEPETLPSPPPPPLSASPPPPEPKDSSAPSQTSDKTQESPSANDSTQEEQPQRRDENGNNSVDAAETAGNLGELTELPDTTEILKKLGKIRDSKREVIEMLDTLKREAGEDAESIDKEKLVKLLSAYDGFKAQEDNHLALLEKVMVLKEAFQRTETGLAALDRDEESGTKTNKAQLPPQDLRVAGGLLAKVKSKPKPNLPKTASDMTSGSEADADEAVDELDALKEQRDLLKKMLFQQKALREKQQKRAEEQMAASNDLLDSMHSQTSTIRSQVRAEMKSIEAKKAELEELKAKFAQSKSLSAQADADGNHSNGEAMEKSGEEDAEESALAERLAQLQAKREEMLALVGSVGSLEASVDSMDLPSSEPPTSEDEEALQSAIGGLNEQYGELSACRERLISLQSMAAEFAAEGRPLPPELKAAIESVLDGMEAMNESEGAQTPTPTPPTPPITQTMDSHSFTRLPRSLDQSSSRMEAIGVGAAPVRRGLDDFSRPVSQRLQARAVFKPKSPIPSPQPGQLHQQPPPQPLPQAPPPPPQPQPLGRPSEEALSQQLILSQLLNCQQQLQLQGMEMRAMQGHLAELSLRGAVSVSPSPASLNPAVATSRREAQMATGPTAPTVPMAPAQPTYDGRPLSTGSLYNLLAPNPYLPFSLYNPGLLQAPMGNLLPQAPNNGLNASAKAAAAGARHPWAPEPSSLNASWHPGVAEAGGPETRSMAVPGLHRAPLSASISVAPGHRRHFESASDSQPEPIPEEESPVGSSSRAVPTLDLSASPFQSPARRPPPPGLDQAQFDALREQIYSEVAALISHNEDRPQFLLQLFRTLQLFSDDFLRSKAIAGLQDQLAQFLDEPRRTHHSKGDKNPYLSSTTFDVTSDYSEDEPTARKVSPGGIVGASNGGGGVERRGGEHDYSEAAESASSLSTPSPSSPAQPSPVSLTQMAMEIHGILGPFLQRNKDKQASEQILSYVRKTVEKLVEAKCPKEALPQLPSALEEVMAKFQAKVLSGVVKEELLEKVCAAVSGELSKARLASTTPRLPPIPNPPETPGRATAALDSDIERTLEETGIPEEIPSQPLPRTVSHPQKLDLQHEPHPEDHPSLT